MDSIKEQINRIMETVKKNQSLETSSDGFHREYKCNICKDIYWVVEMDDEQLIALDDAERNGLKGTVRPCECEKKRQVERMFRTSHITEEFQKLGFQNFTIENRPLSVIQARDAALDYLKQFDEIRNTRCNSIALLGKPGCGKTHLLMAICNNLMRRNISVMYFPWVEGMNELKDKLDKLEQKTDAMKNIEVLYIDDLYKGRRAPTDWSLEQLFGIVNYRYLNHKPTLLSCERDIDELCEVDEGIGSRLYEMSRNYTVLIKLTDEEKKYGMKINYRIR